MKNAPSYNLHDITGDIMLLKKPKKQLWSCFSFFYWLTGLKKTDLNEPFLRGEV